MTGSEGLLGVVTEVTVRILQKPETARAVLVGFATARMAGNAWPTSFRPASFRAAWK
jgi:FAD/FMN-containing dehydrogenase